MRRVVAFLTAVIILGPLAAADPAPAAAAPLGQCPQLTPPPSDSTSTPVFPQTYLYACNSTAAAASGLRVFATNAATLSPLLINAPGCPAPRYEYSPPPSPLYHRIDVLWDTACVDPGEAVLLAFGSDCPGCEAEVNGHSWLFGTPTPTPTPTPSPTPTATPSLAPTSPPAETTSATPTPTVVPGALPKTGGTNEAGGGPSELLAALAGFGGLLVAATCIGARLRQLRRSPPE